MDKPLTFVERQFFYMPLMHAEDPDLQALSIAKFAELRDEAALIPDFAKRHQAAIARFGRFPVRNAALGRASTPEEKTFLSSGENKRLKKIARDLSARRAATRPWASNAKLRWRTTCAGSSRALSSAWTE